MNGFSKKRKNHQALRFAFKDYCPKHMTLKETVAKASGRDCHPFSIRELIIAAAKY